MEPVNGDFLETIVLEWRAEQPNSFENVLAYTLEWQGSGKTKITLRGDMRKLTTRSKYAGGEQGLLKTLEINMQKLHEAMKPGDRGKELISKEFARRRSLEGLHQASFHKSDS